MAHNEDISELKPRNDAPRAPTPEDGGGEDGGGPRGPRVGELLSKAREEHGLSQRDIADVLHIRYAYIQALEESAYESLPGTTYALGFLRTYSQHLDLDVEEMVRRYKEEATGSDRKPQLVFPTPVPESRVPNAAFVMAAVVLVGAVYGAWFYLGGEGQMAERVPAVPERLQDLVQDAPASDDPAPDSPVRASSAETAPAAAPEETPQVAVAPESPPPATELATASSESGRQAPPADSPVTVPAVKPETVKAEEAPEKAPELAAVAEPPAPTNTVMPAPLASATPLSESSQAAAPQVAAAPAAASDPGPSPDPGAVADPGAVTDPGAAADLAEATAAAIPSAPSAAEEGEVFGPYKPRVYGVGNADARIILRAIQDSWVQVRDGEDELLLTRLLRAGDVYRVPDRDGLTMLTGNAGGLEIVVDGTSLGPVGPIGRVRRDIALDPPVLLGTATPTQ